MMTALLLDMRHAFEQPSRRTTSAEQQFAPLVTLHEQIERIWLSPPVGTDVVPLLNHPEENNASHHERYTEPRHQLSITIEFAFVQNLGQVDDTVANEIILLVVFVEAAYVE